MDLIIFILIVFFGFLFTKTFKNQLSLKQFKDLKRLWVYHVLFGVVYWGYIVYGPGGDSIGYYNVSKTISFKESFSLFFIKGPGTNGMYLLNSIPAKFMGFFGLTIVYTLIGYMGILYFYIFYINNIKFNPKLGKVKLFPLVFFMPNLHFWSAGLGKDTLLFFCISMFVYSMQVPSKNIVKIFIALVLSYIVRPHITIFLIVSFGLGFVLDGKLKAYQKFFFGGIFIIAFIVLFDNIMAFLKLESLDVQTIDQFSETRVSNLSRSRTSSGIDISNYPFPLKVFTFLYRPLFFDINGALAIVASFENLFLLVLSWRFVKLNPMKIFKKGTYMVKSLFIFVIIGSTAFSIILGNLGIMLRQKNMFIPALIFVCLWGLSYDIDKKIIKEKLLGFKKNG